MPGSTAGGTPAATLNRYPASAGRQLEEIQGEFKNRGKSSRRGNEAELFFAPKSASSRRRLPFLNTPWTKSELRTFCVEPCHSCMGLMGDKA